MKIISAFIVAFCVAAILIGGLYMFCPDGALSKSVKYILSLAFLLTVISATGITVKNADFSIDFTLAPATDSYTLETQAAEYVYSYALQKNEINYSKIEILTDKTDNGGICINKVIIYSDSERSAVLSALGDAAENTEVEVRNE